MHHGACVPLMGSGSASAHAASGALADRKADVHVTCVSVLSRPMGAFKGLATPHPHGH